MGRGSATSPMLEARGSDGCFRRPTGPSCVTASWGPCVMTSTRRARPFEGKGGPAQRCHDMAYTATGDSCTSKKAACLAACKKEVFSPRVRRSRPPARRWHPRQHHARSCSRGRPRPRSRVASRRCSSLRRSRQNRRARSGSRRVRKASPPKVLRRRKAAAPSRRSTRLRAAAAAAAVATRKGAQRVEPCSWHTRIARRHEAALPPR